MQPTNCSVRNVFTVNTFHIKTIAAIVCISIKIPRQTFVVQNLPITLKASYQHFINRLSDLILKTELKIINPPMPNPEKKYIGIKIKGISTNVQYVVVFICF